jgi:hypothetical protein
LAQIDTGPRSIGGYVTAKPQNRLWVSIEAQHVVVALQTLPNTGIVLNAICLKKLGGVGVGGAKFGFSVGQ